MARAAHDRLGPGEFDARVVAFAEGAVAIAGQKIADLAETHGAIGFGVAAASDVEIKNAGDVGEDLDRQRIVLGPEMQDRLEAFEVRPAWSPRRHFGAGGDRRAADRPAQNVPRALLAERRAHLLVDRGDDRRLDLSARENAEFV